MGTPGRHECVAQGPSRGADGVTNVHLLLTAAKANNRQAYVVRDGSGYIVQAYL